MGEGVRWDGVVDGKSARWDRVVDGIVWLKLESCRW